MMNIRTRRTGVITAIGTALVLAFSFAATPAHGSITVHKLNFEGEVTCPDSNPIKGMTYDARSGHVSTQCYTQFYWDANMMGGELFMEFDAVIIANQNPDAELTARVAQAVSDWRAERVAIDALRDDAQRRAQAQADANPGDVICKAWSYTSRYNGSGGGTACAVNNNPVDVSVSQPNPTPTSTTAPAQPVDATTPTTTSSPVIAPAPKKIIGDAAAIKYFAAAKKIIKQSTLKSKITLPKAPLGTKITIKKSSGNSCKIIGRTVEVKKTGSCSLNVTIHRNNKLVGKQKLVIIHK
jgi:hypothetical protein